MVLTSAGGEHVATFYGPEAERNATLGAASGELLDALELLVYSLKDSLGLTSGPALAPALLAIKKARGQ